MKRKLTLFLSAAVAMSSLPMTAYAANFKDINEVAWAASAINGVADKGLLSGYEDGTFRGKNNVTYPEAMQMLYNAMVKSGVIDPIDAVTAYGYMATLNTYKVPGWSQMAVAYGLDNGLISMQDMVLKFANGGKAATREDIAKMFGAALAYRYDVDGKSESAKEFIDFYTIDPATAPLVDLLKRLEIVSGDTAKRFNPKHNINRAEMAVMLNKTFDVLTEGIGSTGKIVDFQNNDGDYFFIEVEMENGRKLGFHATPQSVKAYDADGKTMALSRLGEGDEVRIVHNGDMLYEVHVTDGISDQEKYDITGYITNMKDKTVTLENENTGETDKYTIDNDCYCYVDGVQVKRAELEEQIKEKYNKYAYAGLIVEVDRQRDSNDEWEYVTEVVEIHVTFAEEYTATGKVDKLSKTQVKFKPTGSSNAREILFAEDCEFYVNGSSSDLDDLVDMADAGTTYVKVSMNTKERAIKVDLSEDAFEAEGSSDSMENRVLRLEDLSDKRMKVSVGGKDYTYTFDSKNPIDNVKFYVWDSEDDDGDWEEADEDEAIAKVDAWDAAKDKVYCQIDFNSGGKISSIELSRTKKAWSADDDQNERKGTVASLKDGVLKFENVSTEYTMRNSYNLKDKDDSDDVTGTVNNKTVRFPMDVMSSVTTSLTVFERMANDDDLKLYAEIIANGDNEVQAVEARLTHAEGKMVEFNRDEDYIKIETSDGEYKLHSKSSPELTDEEEDFFELKDIEDKKYAGEKIELGFNSEGVVNKITVVDGPTSSSGSVKVSGIATGAKDGLKIEGKSKTYDWMGKTSDIAVKNYSGPSESLTTIKKMIEDDALEVFVEARLNDNDKVESIKVYVRSVEGEIDDDGYGDYLRINTENGNTFSFDVKSNVVIEIDDYDEDDLEDGKADGIAVEVDFADDGAVSKIKKAE